MYKKYLAEFIGTFGLALAVYMGSAVGAPVPLLAALVVGLFVYTLGAISGCHLNPAVTLAVLSLKKISGKDAVYYLVAQFAGAGLAWYLGSAIAGPMANMSGTAFDLRLFLGEALGAGILTFGIASVMYGKAPSSASGFVIGGSLLVGITIASLAASGAGVLNPAVALALSSLDLSRVLGPIAGSLAGFWTYRSLV